MATVPDGLQPRCQYDDLLREVDRVVRRASARFGLKSGQPDELRQLVWLRLLQKPAILGQFRGGSSLQTYLFSVATTVMFSSWQQEHGRWRPSAAALRLGSIAAALERLVSVDGLTTSQAVDVLAAKHQGSVSYATLQMYADGIRPHYPVWRMRANGYGDVRGSEHERDWIEEHQAYLRVRMALQGALATLAANEARLLQDIFVNNCTPAELARTGGGSAVSIRRRLRASLTRIRRMLMSHGLDWSTVCVALSCDDELRG